MTTSTGPSTAASFGNSPGQREAELLAEYPKLEQDRKAVETAQAAAGRLFDNDRDNRDSKRQQAKGKRDELARRRDKAEKRHGDDVMKAERKLAETESELTKQKVVAAALNALADLNVNSSASASPGDGGSSRRRQALANGHRFDLLVWSSQVFNVDNVMLVGSGTIFGLSLGLMPGILEYDTLDRHPLSLGLFACAGLAITVGLKHAVGAAWNFAGRQDVTPGPHALIVVSKARPMMTKVFAIVLSLSVCIFDAFVEQHGLLAIKADGAQTGGLSGQPVAAVTGQWVFFLTGLLFTMGFVTSNSFAGYLKGVKDAVAGKILIDPVELDRRVKEARQANEICAILQGEVDQKRRQLDALTGEQRAAVSQFDQEIAALDRELASLSQMALSPSYLAAEEAVRRAQDAYNAQLTECDFAERMKSSKSAGKKGKKKTTSFP